MQITEIFQSIDGEVNRFGQGGLTTFVRTGGCNLHCCYCDTPKAHNEGRFYEVKEVYDSVVFLECPKVTITGGEPLFQYDQTLALISLLLAREYRVTVESNGSYGPPDKYLLKDGLGWVFDYKLEFPDAMQLGMMEKLQKHNWIKFVIQSDKDYKEAVRVVDYLRRQGSKASIAFSPCLPDAGLSGAGLVDRMVSSRLWRLGVSLNLQIHKAISVA